jgi:hypothetical protein
MANRSVFKIFGSIGPSGAIVSLTEKICTAYYPQAYKYGDPEQFESQIDIDLKKIRDMYILELFNYKDMFQKKMNIDNEKEHAYMQLIFVI